MKTEEYYIEGLKACVSYTADSLLAEGLDREEIYYEIAQYLSAVEFNLSEICDRAVQDYEQELAERRVEAQMEEMR